jgi:hypothetical protein
LLAVVHAAVDPPHHLLCAAVHIQTLVVDLFNDAVSTAEVT